MNILIGMVFPEIKNILLVGSLEINSLERVFQMWDQLQSWSLVEPGEGEEFVLSGEGAFREVSGSGVTDNKVPGRLLGRQAAFERIGAEEYVLATVKNGYKLVWGEKGPPPPSFTVNNRSARDDLPWVRDEVRRLNSLGCVKTGWVPMRTR